MSNHVIHVKSCQIIPFISNHVIHVKSCHSCQIMSFMSNHLIHVKSCHSCHVLFLNKVWAGWGGWVGRVGGQKVVPRPSANYFVVSRRQKCFQSITGLNTRLYVQPCSYQKCETVFTSTYSRYSETMIVLDSQHFSCFPYPFP
jgi:hypothetical protein